MERIKKHKGKIIIFSTILVLLIGVGTSLVFFNPFNEQYEGLSMAPSVTVGDNIMNGQNTTVFAEGIGYTGYLTFLQEDGPYTVFVPEDSALDNLPPETRDIVWSVPDGQEGYLRSFLQYHIVEGSYLARDLKNGMKLKTLQGEDITITRNDKDNQIILNGYAYIRTYDIASTNGVIHIITNFVIPPSMIADNEASPGAN